MGSGLSSLHSLVHTRNKASCAEAGWVDPADCPVDQPGLLKDDYLPGDLKFDPFGLMPEDPEEFEIMQTKELQNE